METNTGLVKAGKYNWKRLIKFCAVGFINVVLDFSILNLLSLSTGIHKGIIVAMFSVISFAIVNINSYYLNKKWTFRENNGNAKYKSFLKISIVGVLINAVLIYMLTTHIKQNTFSDIQWLNISKLFVTFIVAVFNYVGYKKFVFNN